MTPGDSNLPEESERSALLSAILNTVRDGIITIDDRSVIVMVNDAAGRIFGYESGELLGNPLTMLMPPDYRDRHRAGIQRYLETGVKRVIGTPVELEGLRKDGTHFPMHILIAETALPGGSRLFTGAVRDLTEEKRLSATIARLSVPVLEIRRGLLLLPLIGEMDDMRARMVMDGMMRSIRDTRARAVVIDVTGLSAAQPSAFQPIVQAAQAARLLGARCLLSGITSSMASALVAGGASLSDLTTTGDLRSALEVAEEYVQ
jgi:PAS domain S-box-containing protein